MISTPETISVTITIPKTALHKAFDFHAERRRSHGTKFAVLKPITRLAVNECTLTDIPDNMMWRISDVEEGWLAGVLYANEGQETPLTVLTDLLGVPNPQTIYPTLSELGSLSQTTDDNVIDIPTKILLGSWSRNMDRFVVAQEVDGPFTHGWGEPTVKHFPAVAGRKYDRYL